MTDSPHACHIVHQSCNLCSYSQFDLEVLCCNEQKEYTVKIIKFGTPQTIAIIVLKIEKFDVTLH